MPRTMNRLINGMRITDAERADEEVKRHLVRISRLEESRGSAADVDKAKAQLRHRLRELRGVS